MTQKALDCLQQWERKRKTCPNPPGIFTHALVAQFNFFVSFGCLFFMWNLKFNSLEEPKEWERTTEPGELIYNLCIERGKNTESKSSYNVTRRRRHKRRASGSPFKNEISFLCWPRVTVIVRLDELNAIKETPLRSKTPEYTITESNKWISIFHIKLLFEFLILHGINNANSLFFPPWMVSFKSNDFDVWAQFSFMNFLCLFDQDYGD